MCGIFDPDLIPPGWRIHGRICHVCGPENLIRQRPNLVRSIMPAGLHAQELRFGIWTAGAQALVVDAVDQVACQSVVPVLVSTRRARLQRRLAIHDAKAASPSGLQGPICGHRPRLCGIARAHADASRSGQATAVAFDVAMSSRGNHGDRARSRWPAAGSVRVNAPDHRIMSGNTGLQSGCRGLTPSVPKVPRLQAASRLRREAKVSWMEINLDG